MRECWCWMTWLYMTTRKWGQIFAGQWEQRRWKYGKVRNWMRQHYVASWTWVVRLIAGVAVSFAWLDQNEGGDLCTCARTPRRSLGRLQLVVPHMYPLHWWRHLVLKCGEDAELCLRASLCLNKVTWLEARAHGYDLRHVKPQSFIISLLPCSDSVQCFIPA